jgi:flagellum-specific peptidoglycan hydrolase FlgJ
MKYLALVGLLVAIGHTFSVIAKGGNKIPQGSEVASMVEEVVDDSIFIEETNFVEVIPPARKIKKGGSVTPPAQPAPKNAEEYILRYYKLAQKQYKQTKIPASIILAQGLVESAAGKSGGAKIANNHFGIKCFSKKHKWCCVKACDDSNKDSFRIFETVEECYAEHSKFLKKPRYKKLFSYGTDYVRWARGLKECGYATDKNYARTLISTIRKYKLNRFD